MKKLFSKITADKTILLGGLVSFLLIFLNIIYTAFSYWRLPLFIPLFNQMPWGEARLGTREQIFMPIVIVMVIIALNLTIASLVYEKIPLISRILSITTALVSFFALLFSVRTIQLIL